MPNYAAQLTSVEISPDDPFRPPDWRWQRYQRGYEAWEDRFHDRLSTVRPSRNRDPLAAIDIFEGDPLYRAELEARILARQSRGVIADRMRLGSGVVYWYEGLFFDVRRRLKLTAWITFAVLKPPQGALADNDVPYLWRSCGYHQRAALDALIGAVAPDELVRRGVDAYLRPRVRLPLEIKLSIAAARVHARKISKDLLRLSRVEMAHFRRRRPRENQDSLISPLKLVLADPGQLELARRILEFIQESDCIVV